MQPARTCRHFVGGITALLVVGLGGLAPVASAEPPTLPTDPPPSRPDVTISAGTMTRCGTLETRNLTINLGGTLRVGREGEADPATGGACDGSLRITADRVVIDGTIDAIGARTLTAGPGTPGGIGGGAGHHGTGGFAGNGSSGGPAAPSASTHPPADFGSAGASGTTGALGGRGGGTVKIVAVTDIIVNGQVLARGAGGDSAPSTCDNVAAGGGSGGAVMLSGERVVGTGLVSVTGGPGGSAARGGGGGSGGRVTVISVVRTSALLVAGGGTAGLGLADCAAPAGVDHGGSGSAGTTGLGYQLDRAANVFLTADNPGPFVKGSVTLRVRGSQQVQPGDPDAGPMDIVVCRRYLAPEDSAAPFEDPALDTGDVPLDDLLARDRCQAEAFSAPNVGNDRYERTIAVDLDLLGNGSTDGFYGFYALAAKRPANVGSANYCAGPHDGSAFDPDCDYQSRAGSGGDDDVIFPSPRIGDQDGDAHVLQPTARIGSDTVGPVYTTPAADRPLNGFAGCPDGSLCLVGSTGKLKVDAADRTSGVSRVSCSVTGGAPGLQACGPAPSIDLALGPNDGLKSVNVELEDAADDLPADPNGNVTVVNSAVRWFIDTTQPNQPLVTVGGCTGENGWCTAPVSITVDAGDPNPSGGFRSNAITVLVDGAATACGLSQPGSSSASGVTGVSCPSGQVMVNGDGTHVVGATAEDRLGNVSAPAVQRTVKIDATPPTVTCQSPVPVFMRGAAGQVSATVADSGSGPSTATVSGAADTSSGGLKSLSLTGFDLAGNSTTVACNYRVLTTITETCTKSSLLIGSSCTVQITCPTGAASCSATANATVTGVPVTGIVSAKTSLTRTSPAATTTTGCSAISTCTTAAGPHAMAPASVARLTCTSGLIGVINLQLTCRLQVIG